jgi:hypothetical protein
MTRNHQVYDPVRVITSGDLLDESHHIPGHLPVVDRSQLVGIAYPPTLFIRVAESEQLSGAASIKPADPRLCNEPSYLVYQTAILRSVRAAFLFHSLNPKHRIFLAFGNLLPRHLPSEEHYGGMFDINSGIAITIARRNHHSTVETPSFFAKDPNIARSLAVF